MRISDWSSDVCSGATKPDPDLWHQKSPSPDRTHPLHAPASRPDRNENHRYDNFASSNATSPSPFAAPLARSEEHTSELQSLMRTSYAVFCLTKKTQNRHYDNKK